MPLPISPLPHTHTHTHTHTHKSERWLLESACFTPPKTWRQRHADAKLIENR